MNSDKALRLKIYFANDEKVERVVDLDVDSTLEDLHLTILAAFEFNAGEMASFWLCNARWQREQEIPMLRMQDEEGGEESACMGDVKIYAAINANKRELIYEYDMLLMWELKIEYIEQVDKIESMSYPVLVSESGKSPNPDAARETMLLENDESSIADDLLRESGSGDDYDDIDTQFEDY